MGTSHTTFKRLFADVVTEKSNLGVLVAPIINDIAFSFRVKLGTFVRIVPVLI